MQKSADGAAGTSFALLDQMVAVNDSTYHSAAAGGTTLGVTGSKAGATVTVSIPASRQPPPPVGRDLSQALHISINRPLPPES